MFSFLSDFMSVTFWRQGNTIRQCPLISLIISHGRVLGTNVLYFTLCPLDHWRQVNLATPRKMNVIHESPINFSNINFCDLRVMFLGPPFFTLCLLDYWRQVSWSRQEKWTSIINQAPLLSAILPQGSVLGANPVHAAHGERDNKGYTRGWYCCYCDQRQGSQCPG